MNQQLLSNFLNYLVCPREKTKNGRFINLRYLDTCLISDSNEKYDIIDGVPDLRPTISDYGSANYEHIHGFAGITGPEVDQERYVRRLGLAKSDVENKIVLLGGAGSGTELFTLLNFNPELIVAIDYSPNIRALAEHYKNMRNILFIQADLHALPFKNETFDLTFNSGVLSTVRSPELAVREMFYLTKKGGVISVGGIYPYGYEHRMIERSRLKYEFHKMPYQKAKKILSRIVRRRLLFKRLKLTRLDFLLNGMIIHGNSFDNSLFQALDKYYAEWHHFLTEGHIRQWFKELGITKIDRTESGRQYIGQRPS